MEIDRAKLAKTARFARQSVVAAVAGYLAYLAFGAGDGLRGAWMQTVGTGDAVAGIRLGVELYSEEAAANTWQIAATVAALLTALAIGPAEGVASRRFAWILALAAPAIGLLAGIAFSTGGSRWV